MTLALLDIPEDPAQLAGWLERKLVSLELRDLVAELLAVGGQSGERASLETACGDDLPQVFERGLSVLPAAKLRELLRSPKLLLELQEQVFIDGGEHWRAVERSAEHKQAVDHGWQALERALRAQFPTAHAIEAPAAELPGDMPAENAPRARPVAIHLNEAQSGALRPARRRRWEWIGPGLAAAAVLVGATLWLQRPPTTSGWGWDRPGALAVNVPEPEYLMHLADGANEWFKKRPDSKEALEIRLREFRHGCETLIAAPHPQLAAADRDWLRERCQAWSAKLDSHLADLAKGEDVSKVQQAADGTVRQLIEALRKRADAAA